MILKSKLLSSYRNELRSALNIRTHHNK
uniref:Uncharacterized protein n=1 Tax=Anguilla anguilla TaxID=7936 RepID=A0A0E9TGX5_ANGAN